MNSQNPCTALMKYDRRAFQVMRVAYFYVNGHRFRREAGWLCVCGMRQRLRVLACDVPACTALPD